LRKLLIEHGDRLANDIDNSSASRGHATPRDRWRLRADPPGVLVKFPAVVGGNAQVFLAVPYTVLTCLGGSRSSWGPGRRSASWPNGPARTVRRLSGIWSAGCYRLHYLRIGRQRSMRMNRQHSLAIVGLGRPPRSRLLTRTIADGSRRAQPSR
jgi:hypothetical protein